MTLMPQSLKFRPITKSDLLEVNHLIARSKAYWNYPKDYLAQSLPLILLDESYLSDSISVVGEANGLKLVFAFKQTNLQWYLDHLWVDPEFIGHGYGKQAFVEILNIADAHQISAFRILPDPGAEPFYLKMGAAFTGVSVPSRVANGPTFNEMIYTLTQPLP